MGKIIVEQLVTADGYAADENGNLDFFDAVRDFGEADADQIAFLKGVDAIVIGANTYRLFVDFWPTADVAKEPVAEPINRLPKFVVSNTLDAAPWGDTSLEILRGDGVESLNKLRDRFDGDLIVWGSLTLTDSLLRAGVVDLLRLRTVPILLGAGRPVAPRDTPRRLTLQEAKAYAGGLLIAQYAVAS